jgi:tetratricopeptide (TPR) repeat protein
VFHFGGAATEPTARRNNLDAALAKYEESLAIARELLDEDSEERGAKDAANAANDVVCGACTLARCALASGRRSRALEVLDSVANLLIQLDREDLDDGDILDTAATYHEVRQQIALEIGDSATANANARRAAELRRRIEELTSA